MRFLGLFLKTNFRVFGPNFLTLLRLSAVPLTVYFIFLHHFLWAFGVFALAGITDWLDGYLARLWNVQSRMGALLDPLADKALIVLSSLALGLTGHLFWWLIVLIVFRDIAILMGAFMITFKRWPVEISPLKISKINTFAQIILIGSCLYLDFSYTESIVHRPFSLEKIYMLSLLIIVTITTLLSAITYASHLFSVRTEAKRKVKNS